MSASPSVVILGDMRDLHHHGCEAVMAQMHSGLAQVGLMPTRVLPGLEWKSAAQDCGEAGLVVINGEGALHDSQPVIRELLELAELRRNAGRPTALINFSWFRNDGALTKRLAAFDLVAVRDPQSRAELDAHGVGCHLVPDLAIAQALQWRAQHAAPPTAGFMVSDSTKPELTRELRRFAEAQQWRYLPVLARPVEQRPGAKSRKIHRRCQWARWLGPFAGVVLSPRYHAHLVGLPTLDEYCAAVAGARGVVTGRFHTVCLALGLEVPLLAIASNTPKIESLLTAAGLDPKRRVIAAAELGHITTVPAYDATELASLRRFLEATRAQQTDLFRSIAALPNLRLCPLPSGS